MNEFSGSNTVANRQRGSSLSDTLDLQPQEFLLVFEMTAIDAILGELDFHSNFFHVETAAHLSNVVASIQLFEHERIRTIETFQHQVDVSFEVDIAKVARHGIIFDANVNEPWRVADTLAWDQLIIIAVPCVMTATVSVVEDIKGYQTFLLEFTKVSDDFLDERTDSLRGDLHENCELSIVCEKFYIED